MTAGAERGARLELGLEKRGVQGVGPALERLERQLAQCRQLRLERQLQRVHQLAKARQLDHILQVVRLREAELDDHVTQRASACGAAEEVEREVEQRRCLLRCH